MKIPWKQALHQQLACMEHVHSEEEYKALVVKETGTKWKTDPKYSYFISSNIKH